MKTEYEDIKKLLIDDIKNAQDITARSIAVNTLINFVDLYVNDDDSPNECSEDDVETPWD